MQAWGVPSSTRCSITTPASRCTARSASARTTSCGGSTGPDPTCGYTARMGRGVHDHDSADGLVPLERARETVLSQIHPLPPIELPLTDAYGCVAATDITSVIDLPEFASSGMDGFAVRAADVANASPEAPAELKVVGRAMIGHRPEATVGMGEAVAIATGAPIPSGADAVIPIENAGSSVDGALVRLFESVAAGRHVRPQGEDVPAGTVLVPAGKRVGAPEIGLLANAGVPHPLVHPRPRVLFGVCLWWGCAPAPRRPALPPSVRSFALFFPPRAPAQKSGA